MKLSKNTFRLNFEKASKSLSIPSGIYDIGIFIGKILLSNYNGFASLLVIGEGDDLYN